MEKTLFKDTIIIVPPSLESIGCKRFDDITNITKSLNNYMVKNNLFESDIIKLDSGLKRVLNVSVHHQASIRYNDFYALLGKILKEENF